MAAFENGDRTVAAASHRQVLVRLDIRNTGGRSANVGSRENGFGSTADSGRGSDTAGTGSFEPLPTLAGMGHRCSPGSAVV